MRALRAIAAVATCLLAGVAGTAAAIGYGLGADWDEFLHDVRAGDGDPIGWVLAVAMVALVGGAGAILGSGWGLRWGAVVCTSLASLAGGLVGVSQLDPRGIHHFPLVPLAICSVTLGLGGLGLLAAGARR